MPAPAGSAWMTPAANYDAERQNAQLREMVLHQLFALRAVLEQLMRRAQYGERCIVVVGGDRFY